MSQIVLGWKSGLGSSTKSRWLYNPKRRLDNAITYAAEGHLVTFAPTGAGKGRNVIIPNLLTYEGPTIVVDPKEENVDVTAEYRERFGPVYVLDPFRVCKDADRYFASLNPLDVITKLEMFSPPLIREQRLQETVKEISYMFYPDDASRNKQNEYWDLGAIGLIQGVLYELIKSRTIPAEGKHLGTAKELIADSTFPKLIADKFEAKTLLSYSQNAMSAYLQGMGASNIQYMPSIANTMLECISGQLVVDAIKKSTIDLIDIVNGRNCTIYIVIPPQNLESHGVLLKIWILTLLTAVMRRRRIPAQRTLFLLDECAHLGYLESLQKAVTLMRGYGLQVWMFFQDINQLKVDYNSWKTIVNNCAVVQAFGVPTPMSANELAEVLDIGGEQLLGLDRGIQMLRVANHHQLARPDTVEKCDY